MDFEKYLAEQTAMSHIIQKIRKELKNNIKQLFEQCEELYSSDYLEEAAIVSYLLPNLADSFEIKDMKIFKGWIEKYINNWG